MKKFSKKSMLSFLTVSAIVVTMAGSYAVWDQLSDTKTVDLTLDKPVVATLTASEFKATGERSYGTARTYTSTPTFAVTNAELDKVEAEITPKVTVSGNDVSNQFTIVVKDSDGVALTSENGTYKDSTVAASNSYTIEITPNESASSTVTDAAASGTTLGVEIKGELKNATATP